MFKNRAVQKYGDLEALVEHRYSVSVSMAVQIGSAFACMPAQCFSRGLCPYEYAAVVTATTLWLCVQEALQCKRMSQHLARVIWRLLADASSAGNAIMCSNADCCLDIGHPFVRIHIYAMGQS